MPPITAGISSAFHGALAKPFGYSPGGGGSGVAFGHVTAPFITAYPWNNGVGFGSKFANPATALPATVNDITFNASGNAIFIAHDSSPFMTAYAWSKTGFGTKYANPAILPPGPGESIAYRNLLSATLDVIALGDSDAGAADFISAYTFSKTGAGWLGKFAQPATLPTGVVWGVNFHPNGMALSAAHNTSPFISVYPFSGSGFGLKYANPAVLPPTAPQGGTKFSKGGGMVCCGHAFVTTFNISAYAFSSSGLGSKYADPLYQAGSVPPDHFAQDTAVSSGSVAIGQGVTANFDKTISWRWNDVNGFGARHSGLTWSGLGTTSLAFNPKGDAIFCALSDTTRFYARRWNDTSGYNTAYSNPATLPTGGVFAVAVAP